MLELVKKHGLILLLATLALIARLLAMPHAQVVDSDAVSRAFIGEIWLITPTLITHGVWGPLHAYLNAFIIAVCDNRTWAPILLHAIFGAACTFPVFFFTKRLFHAKAGYVAALIFVFSPVVFRNSLMPMAEVPHAFFVAMAMWMLIKAIQRSSELRWYILAGLSITVAAGLRYESWVLIALFTFLLLFNRKWKGCFFFWSAAMIFPLFWMAGNYLEYGNILYGSDYATYFNTVVHGVNENLSDADRIQRLLFFPISVLHIYPMGLFIVLVVLLGISVFKKKFTPLQISWLIPFVVMLSIYIFKGYGGTLLLQHRFSITLLLLLVPFTAVLIPKDIKLGIILAIAVPLIAVHAYFSQYFHEKTHIERRVTNNNLKLALENTRWATFKQLQAIPQLEDNVSEKLLEKTRELRKSNTPLVLDFFGWGNTYNFAFRSGVKAELIVFLTPDVLNAEKSFKDLDRYENYRTQNREGLLILRRGSDNMKNVIVENDEEFIRFRNELISIQKIDSVESLIVYKFENPF
jgi:4-amino-4-deoxy-L-arabinose transferase-like glycosyltransferase